MDSSWWFHELCQRLKGKALPTRQIILTENPEVVNSPILKEQIKKLNDMKCSRENLEAMGAKHINTYAGGGQLPMEVWEYNGIEFKRLLCLCCTDKAVISWDEPAIEDIEILKRRLK